ncbi:MAG: hypothetical protein LBE92_17870 [Chryseobacterium sp.]|jgi:hypothetical protein|uniref:hypothetical protein n=1 Tax=Chryseobacterium sp. TaxID=1871047 RepID=UPI0028382A1F|nr:hypothetical protein [Chryseobacterium sp.]MDR2237994.1 hypothetical protein [Chryseobacterium sp.]
MRLFCIFLFLLAGSFSYSQTPELTDKKLILYYSIINQAENKIVSNHLDSALILYKKAFKTFEKPFAKDLYNSMQVALKIKDSDYAFRQYRVLKCLDYSFSENFLAQNFPKHKKTEDLRCEISLDHSYRKTLDSLFTMDQHYRKLSGGDYARYQKEIAFNDSIASKKLLKIIQQKGFPNEYDLGLQSAGSDFFHQFYFIIWHQASNNRLKPQQTNFSEALAKALNQGKITPEHVAFLLDLNNSTHNYSSRHFDIIEFIINEGNPARPHDKVAENLKKADCCYVHQWFYPQKRDEKANNLVNSINANRKKLGMSSLDDHLKKKIFNLHHTDFILPQAQIVGMSFQNAEDIEKIKKLLLKLDDSHY